MISQRGLGLGRLASLDIFVTLEMLAGTAIIWALATVGALAVLHVSLANALVGGGIVAFCHWFSEFVHNLGHATAARRTGYPMTGIRFGYLLVFATSLYPADEPELAPDIHIRRALGGPVGGSAATVLIGVLLLVLWATGSTLTWAGVVGFLDSLLVFSLGAFVPLGFTDGSTLLRWRARR